MSARGDRVCVLGRSTVDLAAAIPEFIAERCTGCASCLDACADAAILGVALPRSALAERIERFAESELVPARARETAARRFARTGEGGGRPPRGGSEPVAFGIFVDPARCRGRGDCVATCVALGHGALRMVERVGDGRNGESTHATYERDMRLFRSLPRAGAVAARPSAPD